MFVTILLSCCNHFVLHLSTIGADPQAKDNNGSTPLLLACGRGHKEVSALLLEHGEPPIVYIAEVFGMFCSIRITCKTGDHTQANPMECTRRVTTVCVAELLRTTTYEVNASKQL